MAQPFPEILIIYPKIDSLHLFLTDIPYIYYIYSLHSLHLLIPYIYKNMQRFVDLSLNGKSKQAWVYHLL